MAEVDPRSRVRTIVFGGALGLRWRRLEAALARRPDSVIIRCDGDPAEVLARCERLAPCVLVVNHSFLETIDPGDLKAAVDFGQAIQVLVEHERDDFNTVENLIRMGCMGVVRTTAPVRLVREAIWAVGDGEFWVHRKAMSRLLQSLLSQGEHKLTERESEILHLIGEGLKNQEIASRLFISPQTVRWHLRSLYGKLRIRDRRSAVLHALDLRKRAARPQQTGGPPTTTRCAAAIRTAG